MLLRIGNENLWIKYVIFSDKYFYWFNGFNRVLINLDKYKNATDELYFLALNVKFSGQV